MRSPEDLEQRPTSTRSRWRVVLVVVAVALVVLLASLRSLAGLWTDQMWFASEGKGQVFNTLLAVKVGLAVVFGLLFFVGLLVNLIVVDRIGRSAVLVDPEDEMVRRYQMAVRPYARRIYLGLAAVFGIGAGVTSISQWQNWLLFTHAKNFGIKDPQFGKDVGFYIFKMPFIEFLISWLLVSLILITIVTAVFHYLNGGIRGQRVRPRVRPVVKVHLSVLLALIALVKAAGYFYQKYQLLTSTNGYVEGATYTDVHARLPAIELLFWLSLLAAAILLFNIWRQGWTLPVLALGIWAFVALVIGVIYPAVLQALKVTPAQSSLELPYIARNITATRDAFGINNVAVQPFSGTSKDPAATLQQNVETLDNIRLWDPDPSISQQTFQKLQGLRSYYIFNALGVDRYFIDDSLTPVLSGVRQVNTNDIPEANWVNTHLVYTHGTGLAINAANKVQALNGSPVFGVSNVPPVSTDGFPTVDQAGVFFGLDQPGYVVANTKQPELDYQTASGTSVDNHYKGTGGVKINGFFRRAAFAIRLADFNLLISNLITPDSRIMFVRDVQTMAEKAAPFLSFDADPYSVLVDGHIDWILDGYTTSGELPLQRERLDPAAPLGLRAPGELQLRAQLGQGRHRCLLGQDDLLRGRSEGPDARGLRVGLPWSLHPALEDARGPPGAPSLPRGHLLGPDGHLRPLPHHQCVGLLQRRRRLGHRPDRRCGVPQPDRREHLVHQRPRGDGPRACREDGTAVPSPIAARCDGTDLHDDRRLRAAVIGQQRPEPVRLHGGDL